MMKKFKKSLALILSMLMLISVFQVGASAYFPYINVGGENDAISSKYQITSVNVTDLYGDAVNSLNAGDGVLVSCKVKSLDESGSVQLIAVAYSGSEMVAVKRSDVVTLGKNAEDIGVYLEVSKAADSFKAFLWDGSANLIPLTKSADTASDAVNVLSVEFNGEAVDKTETTHNVTIPVYQLDMPAVQILTDNPAARVEVTSNKAFPLTKQHGDAKETATITATVTLNGEAKHTYTFNVEQDAPQIIGASLNQWKTNSESIEETVYENSANGQHIILKRIQEGDYKNLEYSRSQLAAVPSEKEDSETYNEYKTYLTNTFWESSTLNDNYKSRFVSLAHAGTPLQYGLMNIIPEFLNGTLIQQNARGTDSNRPYSTYSLKSRNIITTLDESISVEDYHTYSFGLDRSATVYVYNKPDTNSGKANIAEFERIGFRNNEELSLSYFNFKNPAAAALNNHWYENHIDVTDETPVEVKIPVGAHPMYVIVKFDEGHTESVVSDVSYTTTDNSTVATTTAKLFEPIPKDDDLVFVTSDSTKKYYTDYIYKVQPWSDAEYILKGIKDEVSGGEVIKLPLNPAEIKNLTFTLNESADIYFVINQTGTILGDWRTAALDWFENGWRMLGKGEAPVGGHYYIGTTGGGREVSYTNYEKHAVKKHFEVDTPVTVSLNLGKFQEVESFKAKSTNNHNQRTMLVIIKKTDR